VRLSLIVLVRFVARLPRPALAHERRRAVIDPYVYIRTVTLMPGRPVEQLHDRARAALGERVADEARRARPRRAWWRRRFAVACLRATVLDSAEPLLLWVLIRAVDAAAASLKRVHSRRIKPPLAAFSR
jgi:hypothetical protein